MPTIRKDTFHPFFVISHTLTKERWNNYDAALPVTVGFAAAFTASGAVAPPPLSLPVQAHTIASHAYERKME